MKANTLYRTASALLFRWAAGNTYGIFNFWHVAGTMAPVHFPSGHSDFSYAQVVLGHQVFCSLCVLFAAYLAWHLGNLVRRTPQAIGAVGWVLFAYLLIGVYISWIFFSGFVLLLSAGIAICVGSASGLATTADRETQPGQKPSWPRKQNGHLNGCPFPKSANFIAKLRPRPNRCRLARCHGLVLAIRLLLRLPALANVDAALEERAILD